MCHVPTYDMIWYDIYIYYIYRLTYAYIYTYTYSQQQWLLGLKLWVWEWFVVCLANSNPKTWMELESWSAGTLERWNLLSSCKAGFMGLVRALAADLLEESGSPARSDSAGSTLASGNIGCACTQKSDGWRLNMPKISQDLLVGSGWTWLVVLKLWPMPILESRSCSQHVVPDFWGCWWRRGQGVVLVSISALYTINLSKEFPALDHFDFIPRRGTSMMVGAGREHATTPQAEQALAIRELMPPFRMIFQRCRRATGCCSDYSSSFGQEG